MTRRFRLVDVFGDRPLRGNPLAVVVDSERLSTEEMLELTRWLGFSETAFLLDPSTDDADYRVRIFTLAGELPFAGHPTLGSCHVWREVSGSEAGEVVQECGAGLVTLRGSDDMISFEAPPLIREGPLPESDIAELAHVLGIDPVDVRAARWVDNGPGWAGVMLEDADSVLALEPDFRRSSSGEKLDIGVVGFYPDGHDYRYELRAFFSTERGEMREDPVTGSLNASVAQWMLEEGLVQTPYLARQGTALGRAGRVTITGDRSSVWVGGRVFGLVSGELDF
jgi:PhzF family phenazine biosynthesis protein